MLSCIRCTALTNSRKKNSFIIHTDFLEFVATKIKLNLAFVQLLLIYTD